MLVPEVIAGVLFVVLLVLVFAVAVLLQAARVGTRNGYHIEATADC